MGEDLALGLKEGRKIVTLKFLEPNFQMNLSKKKISFFHSKILMTFKAISS